AWAAEQDLAHPPLPLLALAAQQQQLGGGQPDAGGLGAGQFGAYRQPRRGEGGGDPVGEAVGPAVPGGAGQGLDLLPGGGGQVIGGGPAFQELQNDRAGEVGGGDVERGRGHGEQVGRRPVA